MGILRFTLALFVLIGHSLTNLEMHIVEPGQAVRFFFIISGFYMPMVLSDKYKTDLVAFYLNRALRILPIYYFIALLTFLTVIFSGKSFYFDSFESEMLAFSQLSLAAKFLVFSTNLLAIGQDLSFFGG